MMLLKWLISWFLNGGGFPCLFHQITGFYCPGCGGTRAIRMLIRGRIIASFCYHPFVPYAALALAMEAGFFVMALIRGIQNGGSDGRRWAWKLARESVQRGYACGFQRRYPKWVMAAVWIVAVNWAVKNVGLLVGIDLLAGVI